MHVVVSGATGLVGHPIAAYLANAGHKVTTLGRRPSPLGLAHIEWSLGADCPDLCFADALVHAAFDHVPGRYRGGEGADPDGFIQRNLDGTRDLFDAARDSKIVFLSSRAVYGRPPPGTRLSEDMTPQPDTLYGILKRDIEVEVTARSGVSLRTTGVYGPAPPGREHKWSTLFSAFRAGRPIVPRVGTEVHADDVAAAVGIAILRREADILNVSDIVIDRRDLLSAYMDVTGHRGDLPPRAEAGEVCEMETDRLRNLGWAPRGVDGLLCALRTTMLGALNRA
ncbi:GDP-6-deoxy-D-mannose reductase [Rhodobacteraceae bacterium THAF1]|uniref:NAD-dependent epimerase/dehydratase family protein n=1 Tax=Palleronia sp. THAF1 TaxID=2587842 RepID=UPI000F3ACA45|nr:NAD(P)-dependent oxidoreductase [Palleronia sp. THAF1]QFU08719.1 NAD dependent epimerase/dehydratase family protein [Palleronia sp. THAF1]VDC27052.1 GDP-6-deoxy-D-mannose reductase [Rhodobacteraceae bacterium THAF1]